MSAEYAAANDRRGPTPFDLRRRLVRLLRGGVPLASCCLVLALPLAPAVEPKGAGGEARATAAAQDGRLTLEARRALATDDRLARVPIGVQVRDGVATLWGTVTAEALARRAVDCVRRVPGIREVRSDLHVMAEGDLPADWPLPASRQLPVGPPEHQQPTSPPRPIPVVPREPGAGVARGQTVSAIKDAPLVALGRPVPAAAAPPKDSAESPLRDSVGLLPPIVAETRRQPESASQPAELLTPRPARPPSELAVTVAKLRQSEGRFQGVEVEVVGGTVYLRGVGPALLEMARAVAQLPGVERVVVVGLPPNAPPAGSAGAP